MERYWGEEARRVAEELKPELDMQRKSVLRSILSLSPGRADGDVRWQGRDQGADGRRVPAVLSEPAQDGRLGPGKVGKGPEHGHAVAEGRDRGPAACEQTPVGKLGGGAASLGERGGRGRRTMSSEERTLKTRKGHRTRSQS